MVKISTHKDQLNRFVDVVISQLIHNVHEKISLKIRFIKDDTLTQFTSKKYYTTHEMVSYIQYKHC